MRLSVPLVAFALVVLAAYVPTAPSSGTASVAPADTTRWQNLQILPDSLSQEQLMDVMRGFTAALGVQCNHCHVWTESGPDFPSDAKPHKDVARGMMRMTWQINTEILPAIDGIGHHGPPKVTCDTCHRGSLHPGMDMESMDHGDAHEHGEEHGEEHGDHH